MPQTTFEPTIVAPARASHHDEFPFDPFAPPAHLTLDLAPVENLFGDSSSEHASDPADELMFFGAPSVATVDAPPPMFPAITMAAIAVNVPKVKKSRKAAEANILKERLAQFNLQEAQQQQQQLQQQQQQQQQAAQQQQFSVALPVPAPPQHLAVPALPTAASTTVLTEDDEYASNASSDDDEEEEDVKPRVRRATAKAAARLDDSSSGEEPASGNKLKRKSLASVGAPPQRTQLTKAELELGATLDLSRDELLNMTSDALEEHAKRLASQRTLTPEEQKRFKRQRRLIKNRESAQLSRMRKKAYVDELERQIADLKEEKDEIRRRAENAERQLVQARAESAQLRALVGQNPALGAPLASLAMPEVPVAVELESNKRRRGAGGITLL